MLGNVQIQKMLVSSFAGNMLQSWCIIDPTGCFSNTLTQALWYRNKKTT